MELSEASRLYEEFCLSRDIELVNLQSEAQLEEVLIKEYNKEFYAEGQAFYAFKRLAVENILWAKFPGDEESYTSNTCRKIHLRSITSLSTVRSVSLI